MLAYGVPQQHREIGVRRALGTQDADLRALVLAQGMRPVALGVCAGVLGSVAAWRIIESFAFGVPAWDVWSLAIPPLAIAGVAAAACLIPARRALRVEPVQALGAS